ncbi:hypothetical protein QN397_12625 [Variovorax sp. RTB1]|uniref:hypothetical protein n=1 Tax=Variovorax sp. RTB1 TaxID=3048631 RepID=UPI002B23C0DF|nr:hypothetical protein [Variovorax sp. RTB1]MEB0112198.1 hypothetical protein [Variovorax sp. RTB1]
MTRIAKGLDGKPNLASVKGGERPLEKHVRDNGSDSERMKDLVRGSVVVEHMSQVAEALAKIKENFEIYGKVKDRFTNPLPSGYRDIPVNVKLPGGVVSEILGGAEH